MEQLHKRLSLFGYRKNASRQHFWKPFELGKVAIHVCFINHVDDFDIMIDVGIRYDQLEEMKNRNNFLLNQKEKKQTFSIGSELGNLSQGKPIRWTIHEESSIKAVVDSIFHVIEEVAFPYINKYTNMENTFNKCLNDNEAMTPFDSKRAMNTVGLAKLLNRTEQMDLIIGDKLKLLEDKNDFEAELFINFANAVRERD